MNARCLLLALLLGSVSAHAQFDLGRILDTGKKVLKAAEVAKDATREFSTDEEVALGEGIAASVLGAAALHGDQNLQRYVNRVGLWVARQSERPDLPWTFGVLDTDAISAFAIPGGIVFVSHGLLRRLGNESELAGVLGHEVAHVVKKHNLNAIKANATGNLMSMIGQEVATQKLARQGRSEFTGLANAGVDLVRDGVFLRPLDRGLEFEADRMGVVLAARAGYDPYGLVAALQMMQSATAEDTQASHFLSTHPPPAERIAELERMGAIVFDKVAGEQVEARYRQFVTAR